LRRSSARRQKLWKTDQGRKNPGGRKKSSSYGARASLEQKGVAGDRVPKKFWKGERIFLNKKEAPGRKIPGRWRRPGPGWRGSFFSKKSVDVWWGDRCGTIGKERESLPFLSRAVAQGGRLGWVCYTMGSQPSQEGKVLGTVKVGAKKGRTGGTVGGGDLLSSHKKGGGCVADKIKKRKDVVATPWKGGDGGKGGGFFGDGEEE